MKRENGYYIVIRNKQYEVALWTNDSWQIVGTGGYFSDDIFDEIGNKLYFPNYETEGDGEDE